MAVGNGYNTGAADTGFYQNKLKDLISNPGSFSGTPGYQFAFDQAMQGTNRANSAMRGSGGVMAALQDRASGLASQNYGDYLKTLGGLSGQEQNYDLGLAGANNTAQGNANSLALGHEQNANSLTLGQGQNDINRMRANNDFTLGQGQNANNAQRNSNDFGLGMYQAGNQFALGQQQNANTAQNNWWNAQLGDQQNQNNYNLGSYNGQTQRGAAQSNAWSNGQNSLLDWTRFNYQLNPQQRVA
jgi:hypothetical protein